MISSPTLNNEIIKDIGCFYIKNGKLKQEKKKKEWLNRQIPLHFLLIFLFCCFGAVSLIPNLSSSWKDSKTLELASLASLINLDGNLGTQSKKLPLSVHKIHKLPFSPDKLYKLPLSGDRPRLAVTPSTNMGRVALTTSRQVIKINEPKKVLGLDGTGIKEKYIEVDISEQTMMLYGEGELKGIYKVATGMSRFPTPTGKFKDLRKLANVWSHRYKCWMPYSLEFSSGLFIHELPYWPGGQREGENHLGRPVSHGCVRLGIGPAREVYEFAEIGTPIIIHK